MASSPSSFRVGFFVVLGVSALLVAVFLVGTQEGMFQSTFQVSTYVTSADGVRSGSAVRLAGVDIGVVDKVEVSPQDTRVHLVLKLNTSIQGFVKKDSYATVMPEGLVGSYYVDVTVGSRTGEAIEDGDIIQSREVLRLATVLENTAVTMENIRRASSELTKTLVSINEGHGTLGKLIVSEDIYRHLERMSSRGDSGLAATLCTIDTLATGARNVVYRTDSLVANVNTMVTRLNAGKGTVGALLVENAIYDSLLLAVRNTVQVTEEAKVGAGRFSEDMEALKHHWLLRGYFEDRGYWDEGEFHKDLNRKIDSLRTLERDVTNQMQELERRNTMIPR